MKNPSEQDRIAGQKRRDVKFIQAIIEEQARKGKKITWAQAERELASQTRLSQKERLFQDHRETLIETSPKKEARPEPHKVRITKAMAPPKEDQIEALQRQIKERDEMIEALKATIREQNNRLRIVEKELMK